VCGFIGQISFNKVNVDLINQCNKLVECRGPDSKVTKSSNESEIKYCFIFNRLSIIDLSENANQPMINNLSRNVLMFNGEIFNHEYLRKELFKKGIKFKTSHSDTEVILNGLEEEGIDFIKKLRGQFAIFYFDKKQKKAYLVRDKLGQKPLYFSKLNNELVFGSNLRSLIKLNKDKRIKEKSLDEYFQFGVVSSPNTIFENYYKVCPGEIIEFQFSNNKIEIQRNNYWNIENSLNEKSFKKEEFFQILFESVKIRSIADVEVASILSGGLDSSAITKILSDFNRVNTFSVINDEPKYDESKWSNLVSKKYKTNHNTVSISSKISKSEIFESLDSLDEPYSDPSVVPSYILYKKVANYYKVALTGDGGDELLGGYKRTFITLNKKKYYGGFMKFLYQIYPSFLGTGSHFLSKSRSYQDSYKSTLSDDKFLKLLKRDTQDLYENIVLNTEVDLYKSLLLNDYKYYLPEQMLFKVDRTSMANSLEVRSPFLDTKLVEYIMGHNVNYLERNRSKPILKDYLLNDFDKHFVNRSKQGFVFNLEDWVYTNLNLINDVFKEGQIVGKYIANPLNKLSIHKSRINALRIWKIFVLEYYLRNI